MLRTAAEAASRSCASVEPFRLPAPYRLELDLSSPALADLSATIPVAERTGPVTVAFTAETMAGVLGWVNTLSALSSFLR